MMPPLVSIVIVTWNGRDHLAPCLESIAASDYPADRLQVVLVDNGSTDGSVAFVQAHFPGVTIVPLPANQGFTGGNAAGVEASRGEVLLFLNNDMRIDPGAIRALVGALGPGCGCAAARVLSWDGQRIDFIRGTVNFEGFGFQEHYGEPTGPAFEQSSSTFFPNGGAFAVTRDAYNRAGGFDTRYFAYYDDVDLGWRLRLSGTEIRVAAGAVVYHRHGATSRRYPLPQKQFLMDRNALLTVLKNYESRTLDRALPPILLLAARRIVQETRLAARSPFARALAPFTSRCRSAFAQGPVRASDIYRDPDADERDGRASVEPADAVVRRLPVERLVAVGSALLDQETAAHRETIQEGRRVPDAELLPLMGRALSPVSSLPSYRDAHAALVDRLELPGVFRGRTRLLIITHEPLGTRFSGPGVRVLEMGRALAAELQVTIAAPCEPGFSDDRCAIAPYRVGDPGSLQPLAEAADVILVQGFTLSSYPFLLQLGVPIVADLYCPFTVEHLEMHRSRLAAEGTASAPGPDDAVSREAAQVLAVQNDQLRHADFFICASERQRDFWLGMLHAVGRLTPQAYAADPTLRQLIAVVPFGLPSEPPVAPRRALKGVRAGIGARDRVLLWAGSILDWQDPATAIRAVGRLASERDDVRLFFMGTRHPNPQVAPMRAVTSSIELARELQLLDTHVIFNDWVPYHERTQYLLDADLGISTHPDHLETHLSFRTRILDYLWAGLPIVCTSGDYFATLVASRDLGLVVPPGDPEALADAIRALLDDPARRERCRANLADVARDLRWDVVVAPLREFCRAPRLAPDRARRVAETGHRIARSMRFARWARLTAIRLGLPESSVERARRTWPVQRAVALIQRLAASGPPRG